MHGARQKRPDLRAFTALCCGLALSAQAEIFSAKVIAVMDGDTLMVLRGSHKLKVRLANIDAPEKAQPFGKQSRQSLLEMVGRKQVQIDSRAVDQYGRTIARVTVDGVDVNQAQVKLGYAWAGASWRQNRRVAPAAAEGKMPGDRHEEDVALTHTDSSCISLQNEARLAGRGLWVQDEPQAPWQWRKLHPVVPPPQIPHAANMQAMPVNPDDTQCGRKRRCSQMVSCEEARRYFGHCGLKSLDANGDGEPCESLCGTKQ